MGIDAVSREDLKLVRRGDQILAKQFNALIKYARSQQVPPFRRGYMEESGTTRRDRDVNTSLWVRAQSSVSAAPFSLVEVYNGTLQDDGLVFQVRQATSSAQMFAGNESYDLVAGVESWVRLITPYDPVRVTAYGSPTWLQELIPQGVQATPGNGGQLLCIATADSAGHVGVISMTGSPILVGQTTVNHAKGSTKTVNIFRGPTKGLETFTPGDTVQAYNRFATIAAGKWVAVAMINEGWELICAEC